MASQIIFFERSFGDISNPNSSATASNNPEVAHYALNRQNSSAWVTTDSNDAENTTWEVSWEDGRLLTEIFLIKHNFKSFKIEYWDGDAYHAFSPAIDETANTAEFNRFTRPEVEAKGIRITIRGTHVADSEKYLYQCIQTRQIGQLQGWPVIKDPRISRNLKTNRMLSGKMRSTENVGYRSLTLELKLLRIASDIALLERLYTAIESFLVWICGGDEDQFFATPLGYRKEDFFLARCANDYEPEFYRGVYSLGLTDLKIKLEEVAE